MPTVDLAGRRAERQAQLLQMMNQMRNRSAGRPSAMEELDKEYRELEAQRREEERKNRATQAEIDEGVRRGDIAQWGAGQKEIHNAEDAARADTLLKEGQLPHLRAQTKASEASAASSAASAKQSGAQTKKIETETEGERAEQERKATEARIERARGIENDAIRRISMGEALTKEDTDALQDARRLLSGNAGYTIPRNPDGSWKVPPEVARGMLDKSGVPTTKYGEGIAKIEAPKSPYGKLVADAMEARANGADPEIMALWSDKFFKENALNKNQLEWRMAKKFIDVGDFEGAQKVIGGLQVQKDMKLKLPSVEERQEFARQTRLVDDMDTMEKQYDELVSSGRIPVGALRQPFYKILQVIGKDDPEVTSFIKRIEQMKGEYLLYLSGRAATDAERDDINNRIPTAFDSPQTFRATLPQFREKVAKDVSIDAGILQGLGLKIPDGIPVVDPGDVLKREGKLPNLVLENGYIPGDYAAQHIQGVQNLGAQIGGNGEFRVKPLGPGEQLGESTEGGSAPGAPAPLDPLERNSLQREADELRRQLGVK